MVLVKSNMLSANLYTISFHVMKMAGNNKKDLTGKLVDFEEITVSDESVQPTIEIAQQPEFYKIPKRFGTVPVDELPLGYVKGKGYSEKFPIIRLPFQKMEEISFGNKFDYTNKIYWGDNLHIMRMLPPESIDLIYIDPPFFSGRNYNVIFGDENEVRSFSDIWDGGLPTYLIWLNARLLEMKRLLKPTGSIYVHLDWHASHYVKVEMDKIFGYDNFQNEIIWHYQTGGASKNRFSKKHDNILWYSKSHRYKYYGDRIKVPRTEKALERARNPKGARISIDNTDKNPNDVLTIQQMNPMAKERIGYPTQKPEELIEKFLLASSDEGDVVADFFSGGGTTAVVAEKLNRKWIVSDISRIAVEITKGRIFKAIKESVNAPNSPNIEVLSWGYYDISSLSKLTDDDFTGFILSAFGARRVSDPFISGLKQGIPVWVGPKEHEVQVDENPVLEFAEYLEKNYESRKRGIMIAWQFSEKAKQAQDMLAKLGAGIEFVSIDLVPIGSDSFKKHIVEKSDEYAGFLRFILPPVGRVRIRRISERTYEFDFSESVSLNNGKVINIQADFDFDGIFIPTTGFAITGPKSNEKGLIIASQFTSSGKIKVAFKIEDDQGGESLIVRDLEVT